MAQCNKKMQVQLPVATKAKLVRQALVQKQRGFIQGLSPGRMVFSRVKDHLPFLLKRSSYRDDEGKVFLFLFYTINFPAFGAFGLCPFNFLAYGMLLPYPFNFPSLGVLSVRASPVPS